MISLKCMDLCIIIILAFLCFGSHSGHRHMVTVYMFRHRASVPSENITHTNLTTRSFLLIHPKEAVCLYVSHQPASHGRQQQCLRGSSLCLCSVKPLTDFNPRDSSSFSSVPLLFLLFPLWSL